MAFFTPHMAPVTDGLYVSDSLHRRKLTRRIKLFAEAETLGGKRFVNDTLSVIIDVTGEKVCRAHRPWCQLTPDPPVFARARVKHSQFVQVLVVIYSRPS